MTIDLSTCCYNRLSSIPDRLNGEDAKLIADALTLAYGRAICDAHRSARSLSSIGIPMDVDLEWELKLAHFTSERLRRAVNKATDYRDLCVRLGMIEEE